MNGKGESVHWKQAIDEMMTRSVSSAPTAPGVYRLPCGECYVDFFIDSTGA